MFKPSSGRKHDHPVWEYFEYEKSSDKTRCQVIAPPDTTGSGRSKEGVCGQELVGKNTTNLKNHLRSKHKEIYEKVTAAESMRKEPKDERSSRQTTLSVKVRA